MSSQKWKSLDTERMLFEESELGYSETVTSVTCEYCSHGEMRGYPTEPGGVGTVYFWCPIHKHHDRTIYCPQFAPGGNKKFDKHGNPL